MLSFGFFPTRQAALLLALFLLAFAVRVGAAEFTCVDDQSRLCQNLGTEFVALVGDQLVLEQCQAAICLSLPARRFCTQLPLLFSRIYRGPPALS